MNVTASEPYAGPYVVFTERELRRIWHLSEHALVPDPTDNSIKSKIERALLSHPDFKTPMK